MWLQDPRALFHLGSCEVLIACSLKHPGLPHTDLVIERTLHRVLWQEARAKEPRDLETWVRSV